MSDTRGGQGARAALPARRAYRWPWQTALAVLLAVLVVEGQPVAASYATTGPTSHAGRSASVARSVAAPAARAEASTTASVVRDLTAPSPDARPDFLVTFAHLDDIQASRPFSYTLQVRNDGTAGGAVSVSTILPPELSNVRVTAPGFVCTRRFSASGPQAGTIVGCLRGELESGGTADLIIEANAPATLGAIRLTASADPRDEVAEADETNNDADVTVQVHV